MKILLIHEVEEWMFNLDLSEFSELTFDDGLYSQYYYIEEFLKFNKPMKFFINTGIIAQEDTQQNLEFPTCEEAHKRFFNTGDINNYMKWSQILEISNMKNCEVGGHTHSHRNLKQESHSTQVLSSVQDLHNMFNEFSKHNLKITTFSSPYNYEIEYQRQLLEKNGVKYFYGKERVDIKELK